MRSAHLHPTVIARVYPLSLFRLDPCSLLLKFYPTRPRPRSVSSPAHLSPAGPPSPPLLSALAHLCGTPQPRFPPPCLCRLAVSSRSFPTSRSRNAIPQAQLKHICWNLAAPPHRIRRAADSPFPHRSVDLPFSSGCRPASPHRQAHCQGSGHRRQEYIGAPEKEHWLA